MQETKNLNIDNVKNFFIKLMNTKYKSSKKYFWDLQGQKEKILSKLQNT